ncbi:hypothetical protein ACVIQT_002088 [Bradyrhizobium diazoefficiens]
MRSLFAALLFGFFATNVFAQTGTKKNDPPPDYKELVTRLPATVNRGISPPSLGGAIVPVYQDPVTKLYYVAPMLLPDWSMLEDAVKAKCQGEVAAPQSVTIKIDFFRDSIRQEIAQRLGELTNAKVPKENILLYPYASIYVEISARSGLFPARQILQDPPLGHRQVNVQALKISAPRTFTAQFAAPCDELRNILAARDISGSFLAPFSDIAVNSFAVAYSDFVSSAQIKDIMREEKAQGAQVVKSSNSSESMGLNIGGHLGAQANGSDSSVVYIDTRTHLITANLLSSAASEFVKTLDVAKWTEFNNDKDKVADELLKFVLSNSVPVDAEIKASNDNMWKLTAGTESRSLTNDEMKQVLQNVSKQKLEFSEKAGGGIDGFKGEADKKFDGAADGDIKWEKQGSAWVPTGLRLYAISTDRLSQAARTQAVDVLVKSKGMLESPLDPVADQYIPKEELVQIIKKQISDITLTGEADDNWPQGRFWNNNPSNTVKYTCPPKNVLVGMEFDLASSAGLRTPTRYKFICRQITP